MATFKGIIVLAGLMAAAPVLAPAAVVTQDVAAIDAMANDAYLGQSFTTPVDFLYSGLSFNFYSGYTGTSPNFTPTTPAAVGMAFILTQAYAGSPADLGLSTPGFLTASMSSAGGTYTFNPGIVLATGTTYYLYTNGAFPVAYGSGSNNYAGGQGYLADGGGFVTGSNVDFDFTLKGTAIGLPLPVVVPEPSTLMIGFVGAVGGAGLAARRRRTTGR